MGDVVRLQPRHRVRRFVAALRPSAPTPADERWAAGFLSPPERALFERMAPGDRAHVVRVARAVDRASSRPELSGERSWLLPAALLHDVGKSDAPLPAVGRAVVTVAVWVAGDRWAAGRITRPGWTGAAARYACYPDRGASLLDDVGSDPRVVAWAREHHLPPARWSIPRDAGAVLSEADDGA